MSYSLLEAFGIKNFVDSQGEFNGFVITSEINDGVMVSKEHFYILCTLICLISEGRSTDFLNGWLIGFLSQNCLVN